MTCFLLANSLSPAFAGKGKPSGAAEAAAAAAAACTRNFMSISDNNEVLHVTSIKLPSIEDLMIAVRHYEVWKNAQEIGRKAGLLNTTKEKKATKKKGKKAAKKPTTTASYATASMPAFKENAADLVCDVYKNIAHKNTEYTQAGSEHFGDTQWFFNNSWAEAGRFYQAIADRQAVYATRLYRLSEKLTTGTHKLISAQQEQLAKSVNTVLEEIKTKEENKQALSNLLNRTLQSILQSVDAGKNITSGSVRMALETLDRVMQENQPTNKNLDPLKTLFPPKEIDDLNEGQAKAYQEWWDIQSIWFEDILHLLENALPFYAQLNMDLLHNASNIGEKFRTQLKSTLATNRETLTNASSILRGQREPSAFVSDQDFPDRLKQQIQQLKDLLSVHQGALVADLEHQHIDKEKRANAIQAAAGLAACNGALFTILANQYSIEVLGPYILHQAGYFFQHIQRRISKSGGNQAVGKAYHAEIPKVLETLFFLSPPDPIQQHVRHAYLLAALESLLYFNALYAAPRQEQPEITIRHNDGNHTYGPDKFFDVAFITDSIQEITLAGKDLLGNQRDITQHANKTLATFQTKMNAWWDKTIADMEVQAAQNPSTAEQAIVPVTTTTTQTEPTDNKPVGTAENAKA